jgi:hypothetical protein
MGDGLWVTDIGVVWVFDLKTKKGRKAALPGIQFANEPTIADNVLYVSDNRVRLTLVVPELVQSQLRFIHLQK